MKTNFIFCIVFFLSFSVVYAQQTQNRPKFDLCGRDGCTGTFCVGTADTLYPMTLKITDFPDVCGAKTYTIIWGPGVNDKETGIPITTTTRLHTYNLKEFLKTCSYESNPSIYVTVKPECPVATNNVDGVVPLTFNRKPEVSFVPVGDVCEGKITSFTNKSCPTGNQVSYLWDFGGAIPNSTAFQPSVTFPASSTPYSIKLTVSTPACSTSSKTLDISTKKLPVADYSTTGFTVVNKDTVVCLSSGGVLTMDGTISLDETAYDWQITGGSYSFINNTNRGLEKVSIKFNESKTYTVTLTVRNDCGSSKPFPCTHKVIAEPQVQLPKKGKVCQPTLLYQFTPQPDVTYSIDGQSFNPASGQTLTARSAPYYIEAKAPSPCQPNGVIDRDTIIVSLPQKATISNKPRKDTTLCVGTIPLVLNALITGGKWKGSLLEVQAGRTVFNPKAKGKYTLIYGDEPCLLSDTLTITVDGIEVTAQNIAACQDQAYVLLQATPTGGRWTTTDCVGCIRSDTLFLSGITSNQVNATYQITNGNGCPATARSTVTIATIKANFSISNGCSNTVNTVKNLSTGATTYQWLVDNTPYSTQKEPSFILSAGTPTIKLIVTGGACKDETTKQITVIAPPPVYKIQVDKKEGCSPLQVSFSVTGTSRSDIVYSWDLGDGTKSSTFSISPHTFTNMGVGLKVFTVKFVAQNACATHTDTLSIAVKPLAKAEIGVDSTTFRCSPAKVIFSNRSTGQTSSLWEMDGKQFATSDKVLSYIFSAKDSIRTFQVRLIVSSECGKDTDIVIIRIYPPSIKALFTISNSQPCPGETVALKDASVSKATQWIWKVDDKTVSVNQNPSVSVFTQPDKTYKITFVASTSCSTDSSQQTIVTRKLPTPIIKLGSSQTLFCEGQPVALINATLAGTYVKFKWNFGDGTAKDSLSISPLHTFGGGVGPKRVILTVFGSTTGCQKDTSLVITIRSKPKALFRLDSLVCKSEIVNLTNQSQGASSYKWYLNNAFSTTNENPVLSDVAEGRYDIALAVSDGVCKDSTFKSEALQVIPCEVFFPEAFTPDNDAKKINETWTFFGKNISKAQLRIYSQWGEVMYENSNFVPNSPTSTDPNLGWDGRYKDQPLQPGAYPFVAEVEFLGKKKVIQRGYIHLRR